MAADEFRKTILAQMHELLKPMGFRKKGKLFFSNVNDVVLFIQLQGSRSSTKDMLKVTVNAGVFSRTVAERVGNTHDPNIYESHWRARIGFLIPEQRDKWWKVSNEAEATRCASEITSALANYVLPEMQSLASTEKLRSLWEAGKGPGLTDFQRTQNLKALSDSTTDNARLTR